MKYARRTSVLRAFLLVRKYTKKWKRITNGIENGCRERVLTTVCDNKIIESAINKVFISRTLLIYLAYVKM